MIISYKEKNDTYEYMKIHAVGLFDSGVGNVCKLSLQRNGNVEEGYSLIDIRTGKYM